jgi:RHS repeat-associated protein
VAAANDDPDGDGVGFTYNPRFPGQYFDAETGLHYNYFRDYDPATGRYVESDPIGLDGGLNTYGYGLANPIKYTDSLALEVFVCGRPADLPFPMGMSNHEWLLTDTAEAGMGRAGGGVPAQNGESDFFGVPVEVVDHTGQSTEENSHCDHVQNVDEDCVNRMLQLRRDLGRFWPTNNCQTFVMDVLIQCDTNQGR